MTPHSRLFVVFWLLLPFCIISSVYLYFYPVLKGCAFAKPGETNAPFRLLAFGDPQLEGDTSLPTAPEKPLKNFEAIIQKVREQEFQPAFEDTLDILIYWIDNALYNVKYVRKQIDLVGNDLYLAHIYRTLHWWIEPTHVTVLGDLIGSQWIDDEEFKTRSQRFWNRVFKGASKVPDGRLDPRNGDSYVPKKEILGEDSGWSRWLINVPGNHDVGYSGDIEEPRIERFEREFGPIHGDITFELKSNNTLEHEGDEFSAPALRIVVLNTMNLDSPALEYDLQLKTFGLINEIMGHSPPVGEHSTALILLTHIPLHKAPGICVDSPMFTYYDEKEGGGIKEQNLLSEERSQDAILQGIFGFHYSTDAAARGMGRDGILLAGHDHEGCDVYHHINREAKEWRVLRWADSNTESIVQDDDVPGLREVTVRSMMGEFGGNAALLTAWWDEDNGRWHMEVSNCSMGVQHIWWAVHLLNLGTTLIFCLAIITKLASNGKGKKVSKDSTAKINASDSKGSKSTGKSPEKVAPKEHPNNVNTTDKASLPVT